jgi:glycosyltransferase involved in cell wall biosynthesis
MRIALYGHFMYELAVGLRENPDNDVQLFLDSSTLPTCIRDEPLLHDPTFVKVAPWVTHREIFRPKNAEITEHLAGFDVAIVTDLGPIFAASAAIEFVFIPGGTDLTLTPFPIRSRSTRLRDRGDIFAGVVAARMRHGIRAATSIWGPAFRPFRLAVERLGCSLGGCLPQAIDTKLFSPDVGSLPRNNRSESITIFHPARMAFTPDPVLIEIGECKYNDILLKGFAKAVDLGVDARLRLVEREGSYDRDLARQLLSDLNVSDRVEWLSTGTSIQFTWREMADLYRSSDISSDEFGGCFGLAALEGVSCGKPVINYLEAAVMESEYPDGHPFLQTQDDDQVCEAITMLTDPGTRIEIGTASREWVLAHHDRGVVARKCESMLAVLGLM